MKKTSNGMLVEIDITDIVWDDNTMEHMSILLIN